MTVRRVYPDGATPLARQRIVNWPDFAAATVAGLRREAGERPHDARLRRLIAELRAAGQRAVRRPGSHAVRRRSAGYTAIMSDAEADNNSEIVTEAEPGSADGTTTPTGTEHPEHDAHGGSMAPGLVDDSGRLTGQVPPGPPTDPGR